MTLRESITTICEIMGFYGDKQDKVVADLALAIMMNFSNLIYESGRYADMEKDLVDANTEEIIQMMTELAQVPENRQLLDQAIYATVKDWAQKLLPEMSGDQKEQIITYLQSV